MQWASRAAAAASPATRRVDRSFAQRTAWVFFTLLLMFSAFVAFLGAHAAKQYDLEMQQRLSQGLAQHIVDHWPHLAQPSTAPEDQRAMEEVLHMLMVVNPGIEVYILDQDGRVRDYLGDPGSVLEMQVDIAAVRAFLAGEAFPLLGSDPKVPGTRKIFSAAMFPETTTRHLPSGYLYVVLEGQARARVAGSLEPWRVWRTLLWVVVGALLLTFLIGLLTVRLLTRPLRLLALRMQRFGLTGEDAVPAHDDLVCQDEVDAIGRSFDALRVRLKHQALARARQQAAHQEIIAGVAHDLRTPLTALHGYLETLSRESSAAASVDRRHYLAAALAQSDKVRRLSQALFELARLQSADYVLHREHFDLGELVMDTFQKFALSAQPAPVVWQGPTPQPVEIEGDLQLIDRALTNLIDNAIKHSPPGIPVRIRLQREHGHAVVEIRDDGPGLPVALARRLDNRQSVRGASAQQHGRLGGLGLAIAQRIAWLHGGQVGTRPSERGTRIMLMLPALNSVGEAPATDCAES